MDAYELIPVDDTEEQGENKPSKFANETSFKPGQSGNPNGRPKKGYSISDAVKNMLSENPERKKIIIEKIMNAAENGDIVATKLIWNYMDGMPKQEIEQTGEVQINVNDLLKKVYGDTTTGSDSTT